MRPAQNGFSLVEVVVALVILTFGVLALASATGFFFTQIRVADVETDRAMAVQQTVEQLRSAAFDSVKSVAEASATTRNGFKTWYTVTNTNSNLRTVKVYTRGKGYVPSSGWSETALDSFTVSIARSMQQW